MPITFRNRTARCEHSIGLHIRCPVCRPYANEDDTDDGPVGEARCKSSRYRIGEVVAGITIVGRSGDNVRATCGCGEEFTVTRKTVAYWAKAGGVARCRACRDAVKPANCSAELEIDMQSRLRNGGTFA